MTTPFIQAFCRTLFHSLWIGAGVCLLAVIGLLLTHRSSALLRYWMLMTCFIVFIVATAVAGFFELQSVIHFFDKSISAGHQQQFSTAFQGYASQTWGAAILESINQYSGWLVLLWSCFAGYYLLRLWRGCKYTNRLRCTARPLSNSHWEETLHTLACKLGISRPIAILESIHVKVPVTLGHFSSVIIVPLGFFVQLPPAQLEAILLHELAHIYRKDYLVNLLQTLADAVFFFNPGWRWLSTLIREQRENCCDDMVVAQTNYKPDYLKALIAFAAPISPTALAVTVSLHGSPLARRLQRLIDGRNPQPVLFSKLMLFLALLSLPILGKMLLPAQNKLISNPIVIHPAPAFTGADSLPSKAINNRKTGKYVSPPSKLKAQPTAKIIPVADSSFKVVSIKFERSNEDMANRIMNVQDGDGNSYHITIAKGALVGLTINNAAVPEDDLTKHLPLLARIDHAWSQAQARKQQIVAQSSHAHLNLK